MKQITKNVYAEDRYSVPPDNYRGCNWGFVTTSDGIVVIDTPMMPRDAVKLRDELAKRGEIRYIINTHHHLDHIMGNFYLPGTVIAHEGVRELFMAPVEQVAVRRDVMEDALKAGEGKIGYIRRIVEEFDPESVKLMKGYQLRPPTMTFSQNLTLHVGNHTFKLALSYGHTPTHISVYIPEEKVMFTGDNFTNKTQPSLWEAMPLEWLDNLKKIEAMDLDFVIPGHGPISKQDALPEFRKFLEECIAIIRDAKKQGIPVEQAVKDISFEDLYPRKRGGQAVHPGMGMQQQNVTRLYEMLT